MVYLTALDSAGSSDSVVALVNSVIQMAVKQKMAVNLVVYVSGEDFARLQIMGGDPPVVVDTTPPRPAPPKKQVRVKGSTRLNVRLSPPNGTVIGAATQADGWLDVLGEQLGWYRVRWQGKEGWVSAGYVEAQG